MTYKRRVILLMPLSGAAFLAACSKETPNTSSSTPSSTSASPAAPAVVVPPVAEPAQTPAQVTSPGTTSQAPAPAPTGGTAPMSAGNMPLVQPSEPQAVALGYVAQASQADTTKFKNYAPGQACANCALYGGKATDPQAPCPIFAGKQVLAGAWCSAYIKKAG